MTDFWIALERHISAVTGQPFTLRQRQPLGGGCINQAWRVGDGQRAFFVKVNTAARLPMFEAEAAGLAELAATRTVRAPKPIGHGVAAGQSWLMLEYLPLVGGGARAMEKLGRQLAALHAQPRTGFGWHRDNTIGATPQPNTYGDDWIEFWRERRLGFQLNLAARNGYTGVLQQQGEQLRVQLDGLFVGCQPTPALLHGDLWSGNADCTADGEPVIFDPAVYQGDREADLAMTELFGGFPESFYVAYREALPLAAGYPQRRTLYNLYHILNHLNLFGGGYRAQAEQMIAQLLAELR
ncbi:MAG: fructosamine kinase family protein [Candidatus Competibacteraceae bacterium]|nr:fructosamine kinase family protein [Candidatus Competibacteraceae bacterium]